jgi:hypothetical protein
MKRVILLVLLELCVLICISQTQTRSGGTFSNVGIAGSKTTWQSMNNAASSNNAYATSKDDMDANSQYTDYLQATDFGFSIPTAAIINGIEVNIEYHDAGTSDKAKGYRARIVKAGTISNNDIKFKQNIPSNDPNSYTSIGGSNNLWGETWTPATINSAAFGFAFAAQRVGGGGGTSFPAVDHITITVHYTTILPIELTSFTAKK